MTKVIEKFQDQIDESLKGQAHALGSAEAQKQTSPEPRNLGFVDGAPTAQKTPDNPMFPVQLRCVTYDPSKSTKDRLQRYGKWKVKILAPCSAGYGVYLNPGDEAELIGDVAWTLVAQGQAEFDDAKVFREQKILQEADKIRKNNPQRVDPERYGIPKKKNSWLAGAVTPSPGTV